MALEFNSVAAVNRSDIKFGDQWIYTGWPAPPTTENQEATFDERMANAIEKEARVYAAVEAKVAKAQAEEAEQVKQDQEQDDKKSKGNNGNNEDKSNSRGQ